MGRRGGEADEGQADAPGGARRDHRSSRSRRRIWLAFQNKEIDYINLPSDFRDQALDAEGKLLPRFTNEKIKLFTAVDPDLTYKTFNFRDPVVGGFDKEKIALRRAIIMAYDVEAEIRVLRKNLALKDEMPIPAGVVGYEPGYKAVDQYNPELANKLLDHFGYKVGADGWRTMPDGKPLLLRIATRVAAARRQFDELWQKSMERIKVQMQFDVSKFGDNLKAAKACKLMMWGQAWTADYPDGDNFMQLLYGPEHRAEQQRLLRVEGLRRVLRKGPPAARLAGAQPAVPRDDAADGGRRRLAHRRVAAAQPADPSVGEGLQAPSDPARGMAVHRHRRRARSDPP